MPHDRLAPPGGSLEMGNALLVSINVTVGDYSTVAWVGAIRHLMDRDVAYVLNSTFCRLKVLAMRGTLQHMQGPRYNFLGAFLNALMMAAVVAVISGALSRFVSGWQPIYVVLASFIIAVEASVVHYTFRREHMWLSELLRYLIPEILIMVVVMRIAATLSLGARSLLDDLQRWFFDPLSIFDPLFVLFIFFGLVVGGLTHLVMQNLQELEPVPYELLNPNADLSGHATALLNAERGVTLRRISSRFITGGVLVLLSLSVEAVNITEFGGESRAISRLSTSGALSYVVAGLLLYSQARLAMLRARWRQEGAEVADRVNRRWAQTSLLLILGVAFGAALLPRTYGMGLLDTFRTALGVFGYIFLLAGYLIVWFLSLLALIPAWLLSLLNWNDAAPEALPAADVFMPPAAPEELQDQQLQFLPALIFWLCMLILVVYALWVVIQRNPAILRIITDWRPIRVIWQWLSSLWQDARGWTVNAVEVLRERLRPAPAAPTRRELARLRRMGSAEMVRYFYRSLLRRASDRGMGRRGGQTPYEYEQSIAQRLPEVQDDLDVITEAFVAAQYSPRTPESNEARQLVRPWVRLWRRLRTPRDSAKS